MGEEAKNKNGKNVYECVFKIAWKIFSLVNQ